jgi:AcrR family transcriptional regulator
MQNKTSHCSVRAMKKHNTPSALKEKEKDARRRVIVDAAEKEFATKAFNRVNMRDIAKRAGISPALIYRHFPDQQSLFVEAFLRGVTEVFEGIYEMIQSSDDGSIRDVAANFIEFFTRNDQYFRMMMNFFLDGSVDPDLFDKLNILERQMLDNFDVMFRKMKIGGDIRTHSHTLFAALIGVVATFRNHPGKSDAEVLRHRERIAENLAQLYLDMATHHR